MYGVKFQEITFHIYNTKVVVDYICIEIFIHIIIYAEGMLPSFHGSWLSEQAVWVNGTRTCALTFCSPKKRRRKEPFLYNKHKAGRRYTWVNVYSIYTHTNTQDDPTITVNFEKFPTQIALRFIQSLQECGPLLFSLPSYPLTLFLRHILCSFHFLFPFSFSGFLLSTSSSLSLSM